MRRFGIGGGEFVVDRARSWRSMVWRMVAVSAIVAAAGSILVHGQGSSVPEKPSEDRETVIGLRRQWALACSAVLFERNHASHKLLGGDEVTERAVKEAKVAIGDSPGWGLKSKEALIERLDQFKREGHRDEFVTVRAAIEPLTQLQYMEVLERYARDPQALQQIKIVRKYGSLLGDKTVLGWDYGRYICLCRWGYMAEYFSEDEAWERIMPIAEMLQKTFDSWEELGGNYVLGRQFWSYEATVDEGGIISDAFQRLLDMKSSPYNRLDWDMRLSDGTTAAEGSDEVTGEDVDSPGNDKGGAL